MVARTSAREVEVPIKEGEASIRVGRISTREEEALLQKKGKETSKEGTILTRIEETLKDAILTKIVATSTKVVETQIAAETTATKGGATTLIWMMQTLIKADGPSAKEAGASTSGTILMVRETSTKGTMLVTGTKAPLTNEETLARVDSKEARTDKSDSLEEARTEIKSSQEEAGIGNRDSQVEIRTDSLEGTRKEVRDSPRTGKVVTQTDSRDSWGASSPKTNLTTSIGALGHLLHLS